VLLLEDVIYLIDKHLVINHQLGHVNHFELLLALLQSFGEGLEFRVSFQLLSVKILRQHRLSIFASHSDINKTLFDFNLSPPDAGLMVIFEQLVLLQTKMEIKVVQLVDMLVLLLSDLFCLTFNALETMVHELHHAVKSSYSFFFISLFDLGLLVVQVFQVLLLLYFRCRLLGFLGLMRN